jgi:hypothetical protein
VVGGAAVNAYVEPLISLDLDLVMDRLAVDALLVPSFRTHATPESVRVSAEGSRLRVHILDRSTVHPATRRNLLGFRLPVATPDDLVRGLTWSAGRDDQLHLQRILESFPHLRPLVPADILARFA